MICSCLSVPRSGEPLKARRPVLALSEPGLGWGPDLLPMMIAAREIRGRSLISSMIEPKFESMIDFVGAVDLRLMASELN